MKTRTSAGRAAIAVLCLTIVLVTACDEGEPGSAPDRVVRSATIPDTDDPIARACALPERYIRRIVRGYDPVHSEDVTIVPREPNYAGTFSVFSHSGPWDYLQEIPLVAYGPARIEPLGRSDSHATLADIYPTVEKLTGIDLEPREGRALRGAVRKRSGAPKMIVVIVWDGVGWNTLERWPEHWPVLASLERDGASYRNADVGSSPSITPASHATIGTGLFANRHRVPSIWYQTESGEVRGTLERQDPSDLVPTTFADQLDLAYDNASKVGMISHNTWHIAMVGHGAGIPAADHDLLGVIVEKDGIKTNPDFWYLPDHLQTLTGLSDHLEETDRSDGEADGRWHDYPLDGKPLTPGHASHLAETILDVWEREGFGEDEIPDLFFTNFKQTDLVGHQVTLDSTDMAEVLRAQDEALGDMVEWLDANVSDYALFLTSDHGHTPDPKGTGAWPIGLGNTVRDLHDHFGVPDDAQFVKESAYGFYVFDEVADEHGVTLEDIATYLNGYTIGENWPEEELPDGYEDRADEKVFSAAFVTDDLLTEIEPCVRRRSR